MAHAVLIELYGRALRGELVGDEVVLDTGSRIPEADARYLAPVEPTKIICTHLNFPSRVAEFRARTPEYPSYFMKPPSSLNGHRRPLIRPKGGLFLNYEGEVAVVIGRACRAVPIGDALGYVAGFAPANDVGLHDFRHADRGSMLRVKGQDTFCPIGPALVPASEVDPNDLMLRTYVNGELVQEGHSSELLFSYAYLIADLSRSITLEPGDVILTGTPANSRPMSDGDVVEVAVEGLGRLSNTVVGADHAPGEPGIPMADTEDARNTAFGIS
jgi:5-oxopent-3-ene-1,2,5-tricarboxylate decarboxylase/2-hydroxyhepta-2,4-diene-1,7-dioate isomerase